MPPMAGAPPGAPKVSPSRSPSIQVKLFCICQVTLRTTPLNSNPARWATWLSDDSAWNVTISGA